MQLDLLQEKTAESKENTASDKKTAKRPQRHFPSAEAKVAAPENPLPKLPDSLLPPFIAEETSQEEELEKAPGAFKTISETAKILDVPQHVLRFWESRFPQIKPLKLNGGRRYYRPEDIEILTTIKHLLYKQGYTIKGAKKAFHNGKLSPAQPVQVPSQDDVNGSAKNRAKLNAIRQELMDLRDSLRLCLAK